MRVTHLQSSTQLIDFGGITVLTDPWLTDGEYLGSWFHYPPFPMQDIATLTYDYIYVSHIHPDHLSEKTFSQLPLKTPVLIHQFTSSFLKHKVESYGFECIEIPHAQKFELSQTDSVTIYAADNCDPQLCGQYLGCAVPDMKLGSMQIDTLAVFTSGEEVLVNTNDCPFELAETTIVQNGIDKLGVDLLLVGYAGAGPYPQTFNFGSSDSRSIAAEGKKYRFLEMAKRYIELMEPRWYAPFAGTYVLGSRFVELNSMRGVPQVSEALDWLSGQVATPAVGIELRMFDTFDLSEGSLIRNPSSFSVSMEGYLDEIAQRRMDYDDDEWSKEDLDGLIQPAYERFRRKCEEIGLDSETTVRITTEKVVLEFGTSTPIRYSSLADEVIQPYIEVSVDHNLLVRLMKGPKWAHWNNAEIGSHLRYRREPDAYERGLHHALCFFHA